MSPQRSTPRSWPCARAAFCELSRFRLANREKALLQIMVCFIKCDLFSSSDCKIGDRFRRLPGPDSSGISLLCPDSSDPAQRIVIVEANDVHWSRLTGSDPSSEIHDIDPHDDKTPTTLAKTADRHCRVFDIRRRLQDQLRAEPQSGDSTLAKIVGAPRSDEVAQAARNVSTTTCERALFSRAAVLTPVAPCQMIVGMLVRNAKQFSTESVRKERLEELEKEIAKGRKELEGMLE